MWLGAIISAVRGGIQMGTVRRLPPPSLLPDQRLLAQGRAVAVGAVDVVADEVEDPVESPVRTYVYVHFSSFFCFRIASDYHFLSPRRTEERDVNLAEAHSYQPFSAHQHNLSSNDNRILFPPVKGTTTFYYTQHSQVNESPK